MIYRWSHNLPNYWRIVTYNWCWDTPTWNLASEVTGLQVHVTTLSKLIIASVHSVWMQHHPPTPLIALMVTHTHYELSVICCNLFWTLNHYLRAHHCPLISTNNYCLFLGKINHPVSSIPHIMNHCEPLVLVAKVLPPTFFSYEDSTTDYL